MPRYTWSPSANTVDYVLERSVDRGLTWTNIVDIPHNFSGPNYSSATSQFFYDDGAAVLGEIVRIYGRNAGGTGPVEYLHGPVVSHPTCRLFGVLQHSVTGQALRGMAVYIVASDRPYTTLLKGEGVPATNSYALLGGKRKFQRFTDDDGKWSIDLVRGITVTARIPSTGFEQSFIVPEDRDVLNIVDSHIYRSGSRFGGGQQNPWSQGPKFVP